MIQYLLVPGPLLAATTAVPPGAIDVGPFTVLDLVHLHLTECGVRL
jgi:hypothetical protein